MKTGNMTIDTSWSQVIDTLIGQEIMMRMDDSASLVYHNGDHVRRMYAIAKQWRLAYDVNLDLAILFHDAVYDSLDNKEERSATLFLKMLDERPDLFVSVKAVDRFDVEKVIAYIRSTITHQITSAPETLKDCRKNLLIKLDLAELGDQATSSRNFWNILEENKRLYGVNTLVAAQGSLDFLEQFRVTIAENQITDFWSSSFVNDGERYWKDVLEGVDRSILMAQTIVTLYQKGLNND